MDYGFIGLGNMAGALIRGMTRQRPGLKICGFNRSPEKAKALAEECGIIPCGNARETAELSDVVVLAVKPQMLDDVLPLLADALTSDKLVVTIAAGKPLSYYARALGECVPVVRAMPNINARVRASATAVCTNAHVTPERLEAAKDMFAAVGTVTEIPERLFSAFSAISGASVAFAYVYMDALARAGVKAGFSKAVALEMSAQAVLGSARLVQESGEHPMALVDQVCSPAGTTIDGVLTLQRLGFESSVHQAIEAVIRRDEALGK